MQELKIRIHDHKSLEKQFTEKGAVFKEEISVIDTYLNQPENEVLKVVESTEGIYLMNLHENNGKFDLVQREKITLEKKNELIEKFGIKKILKKRMRYFSFENYEININLIEDLGEFLILTGENPEKEDLEKLGINNPEYITVPFSDL